MQAADFAFQQVTCNIRIGSQKQKLLLSSKSDITPTHRSSQRRQGGGKCLPIKMSKNIFLLSCKVLVVKSSKGRCV
jgi:hypothetical protein